MAKSFPETMNVTKLMLAGLKQNSDKFSRRGLDAKFVTNFENTYNDVQTLDNEQERLKADLNSKTGEVKDGLKRLQNLYSEAKTVVKMDVEQPRWKEFGINDKR